MHVHVPMTVYVKLFKISYCSLHFFLSHNQVDNTLYHFASMTNGETSYLFFWINSNNCNNPLHSQKLAPVMNANTVLAVGGFYTWRSCTNMNYDYIMLSTKPHCTILWLSCINTFIGKPLIMREAFLPWFLSLINKINHSVLFWLLFLYFSLLFLTGLHEIAIETRRYFATVLQAAFLFANGFAPADKISRLSYSRQINTFFSIIFTNCPSFACFFVINVFFILLCTADFVGLCFGWNKCEHDCNLDGIFIDLDIDITTIMRKCGDKMISPNPGQKVPGHKVPGHKVPKLVNIGHKVPG